jgi:hypothetical protein
MYKSFSSSNDISGEFVTIKDERYYAIGNVDHMPPFFISVVSDSDHWMYISSNGGLTAGRVSPETALFPYVTVDRVYESTPHTGSKTLLRVSLDGRVHPWEPFNREHDERYLTSRNLYKNVQGNKLLFEEINHDLSLVFRYCWAMSDEYGFVRQCELENLGDVECRVEIVDGLQNILPAGTPRNTQANASYLVDAYKWNELDERTGLAFFTLFSKITDRAEPGESLKATTAFCLGLESPVVLLSTEQLGDFRCGKTLKHETSKRGLRGAYLVNTTLELTPAACRHWQIVANIEQSQSQSVKLLGQLDQSSELALAIEASVESGSDALARILATGDGFQATAEDTVSVHHYANVLFNILRGGTFDNQYLVSSQHFRNHVSLFNGEVFQRHQSMLESLPDQIDIGNLLTCIEQQGDPGLERLAYEYLPVTFGRRHGDPSRPWNQFAIKLTDEEGERLLTYQGNWRDIFQNWEALLFSYPEFIESVIAKFVNASTVDGYNPYRISNEGIDWEVEDPDDPWCYIGYWGDHQIIYLLKLLELSHQFHPKRLDKLLHKAVFSYANVPYKIKPFDAILEDAKNTVVYDFELEKKIEQRVAALGFDGKLLPGSGGGVYQVTLLEKLLVPLLSKLGNFVIDGGIWLNTQRPEWNDANNALVGQGLSMVTMYYLRRYIGFLQKLMPVLEGAVDLSAEVSRWLSDTAGVLNKLRSRIQPGRVDPDLRFESLYELGLAADRYRQQVYQQGTLGGAVPQDKALIESLLDDALAAIDHSIGENQREDGMYHAYNLLDLEQGKAEVEHLYPMLEGQVAVLSSGAISPSAAVGLLETLFDSDVFRADQNSFLLYPDRELPGFLQKNCMDGVQVEAIPLLRIMLEQGDHRIIEADANGVYRFNAALSNSGDLARQLDELAPVYGQLPERARQPLLTLYEQVFNHKAFTGRSGGMFGFEGLGSIYWHMVSKLLLAVQENFFAAREQGCDREACDRLGHLYHRVRAGIGFNKTPQEYGAFPTDPYSHTPAHLGAQQPGMTGQVKEEVLTRFGELGIRVQDGTVRIDPGLLCTREFLSTPRSFRFLDFQQQWQVVVVPADGLAFTWCQVPFIYSLGESGETGVSVEWSDGERQTLTSLELPVSLASELFCRSGNIRQIEVVLNERLLSSE